MDLAPSSAQDPGRHSIAAGLFVVQIALGALAVEYTFPAAW